MTTSKQKSAVHFCEEWLQISFEGDLNNSHEVSVFLGEYLQEAKMLYEEVRHEYESYLWEKW